MESQKRAQDSPLFSASRERFEGSEEWQAMTHADMEGAPMVAGRELMRTFYEELLVAGAEGGGDGGRAGRGPRSSRGPGARPAQRRLRKSATLTEEVKSAH